MKKRNIPNGSDVSSGTYKCEDCGYEMGISSVKSLPPCAQPKKNGKKGEKCLSPNGWESLTGKGDAEDDPQN